MENRKRILLFFFLFCYTFAFFIAGISISILIAIPMWIYAIINKKYLNIILQVINYQYTKSVIVIWYILTLLSLFFPIIYGTYDFSFFRLVGAQALHLFSAFPILAWLKYSNISFGEVESMYINIFIVQTIIQLIVVNNNYLSEIILTFNHFQPENVLGPGSNIRGKALSAATTYHLTMAYGIAFIIYIKRYSLKKANVNNLFIGLLLFVGIFFAGRSGFVACLIGALGYIFYPKTPIKHKIVFIIKIILLISFLIIIILFIISILFPSFYDMLYNHIFPYAFEFIYSLNNNDRIETQSTNHLMEMWNREFII